MYQINLLFPACFQYCSAVENSGRLPEVLRRIEITKGLGNNRDYQRFWKESRLPEVLGIIEITRGLGKNRTERIFRVFLRNTNVIEKKITMYLNVQEDDDMKILESIKFCNKHIHVIAIDFYLLILISFALRNTSVLCISIKYT